MFRSFECILQSAATLLPFLVVGYLAAKCFSDVAGMPSLLTRACVRPQSEFVLFFTHELIYVCRFVPGERIQVFSTSGAVLIAGTVDRIEPLRSIIRDGDGAMRFHLTTVDLFLFFFLLI